MFALCVQLIVHPAIRAHTISSLVAKAIISFFLLNAGAAGCAVAALLKKGKDGGLAGRSAVVVCCGGNMALPMLRGVLQQYGSY